MSRMPESSRLAHDWFDRPLPDNVTIGSGSWLHSSYAFLNYLSNESPGVIVGEHSGAYQGTYFNLGPAGSVRIGDYCTIVAAIFASNSTITIGSYSFIAHEVVIGDCDFAAPPDVQVSCIRNREGVHIGENVWICARAVLLNGAVIGEGAIVGAAAVVDFEVPPFAIVAGNPARVVGDCRANR